MTKTWLRTAILALALAAAGCPSGSPEVRLDRTSLQLGEVAVAQVGRVGLVVENPGSSPLAVNAAVLPASGAPDRAALFRVEPKSLTVAPGASATLEVTFAPVEATAPKPTRSRRPSCSWIRARRPGSRSPSIRTPPACGRPRFRCTGTGRSSETCSSWARVFRRR